MPRTYCFVGPSLPDAGAQAGGTSICLMPPVAAGDLLALDVQAGDVVGIVDGYFHQKRAVRHKEILDLLSRGVRVLGASSMGALRAAELDRFGMQGIGRVYADYRDGRIEADDEVTLLHSAQEEGYRAQSEPLVCMRATFAAAVRDGACDASLADRLIEVVAERPFGVRSYAALPDMGTEAGVDMTAVRALQKYCTSHPQDPKREDALLLLDHLKNNVSRGAGPRQTMPAVSRTAFLYAWQIVARNSQPECRDAPVSTLDVLRACQLFADDYPSYYQSLVLETLASQCATECGDQVGQGTDSERALAHGEHRGLYRLPARKERLPFLYLWVTSAETQLPVADQLTTALIRSSRATLRLPWEEIALSVLEEPSIRHTAEQFVCQAEEVNDQALRTRSDLAVDDIPRAKIVELLAEQWRVSYDTIELEALDRGFVSLDNAVSAARPFYLFATFNNVTDRLRVTRRSVRKMPQPSG